MKLCIECKWMRTVYVYGRTDVTYEYKCGYPEFVSLVDGKPIELCENLRWKNLACLCGVNGIYWEKKP